ncbi:AZOBR_p60025 family cell surface glycopolymer formation protein [Pelagicoccus mobilis]|uniref:Uncharacterized protein n=1 Tax=Pelagicoccus mobilis TaxID=415221 RepID=A0A934RSR0_9BACT|nr:hypothetical protein [Pelagicoccus mobilis]MBK1875743.1 hypothetical protein [Pelagicoccus mobilis]
MRQQTIQVLSHIRKRPWHYLYAGVVLYFVTTIAAHYAPPEGFTSFLNFGDRFYAQSTDAFKSAEPRVFEDSPGYDGQFYAQIALNPTLSDPQLQEGLDNFDYRARRVLMPSAAWLLGLGQPVWILNAFALLNPLCWLAFALLLTHWLPPSNFQNFIRWGGILFGAGWATSIQSALTDGPAILLTLLAIYFATKEKRLSAAGCIAASALTKDASLLTGLSLFSGKKPTLKELVQIAGLGLITLLPLVTWTLYIESISESNQSTTGSRNFALPFAGLWQKYGEVFEAVSLDPKAYIVIHLLSLIGLSLQIAYFLFFPNWKSVWWRCGIGFAVLGCVLGHAVWEGFPSAAPRVLIVLHLCFNLSCPRGKAWLPLLLFANVSVIDFPERLQPPPPSDRNLELTQTIVFLEVDPSIDPALFELDFQTGWHRQERSGDLHWKWSEGIAEVHLLSLARNPIEARLQFLVSTHYERNCIISLNGDEILRFDQKPTLERFASETVLIQPGTNTLSFGGDSLGKESSPLDPRKLGLSLFKISLLPANPDGSN